MDYKQLKSKELAERYIKASTYGKKKILRSGIDLNSLIVELSEGQIIELAQIHPDKEILCDILISNIENYKNPIKPDRSSLMEGAENENLNLLISEIESSKKESIFGRIINSITGRNTKLKEGTIEKKIEELRKGVNLISAAREMSWYSNNSKNRASLKEEETGILKNLSEFRYRNMYNSAINKYKEPKTQQLTGIFKDAYIDFVDEEQKNLAEVLGIAEFTQKQGKNIHSTIANVTEYDNYEINGYNLGKVYIVRNISDSGKIKKTAQIYRKNKGTGEIEKIGKQYFDKEKQQYKFTVNLGKGMPNMIVPSDNASYQMKETIEANEIRKKTLLGEIKRMVGENTEIREMTEVQLTNQGIGILVKTVDIYGSSGYQMITMEEKYPKKGDITISKAKDELFKTIQLPTVHSDGDDTIRDKAKVVATLNLDREELQIYTNNHGNTSVAVVFGENNNAYPLFTNNIYKNNKQRNDIYQRNTGSKQTVLGVKDVKKEETMK